MATATTPSAIPASCSPVGRSSKTTIAIAEMAISWKITDSAMARPKPFARITCTISVGVACWQTHYEKVSDWVRDADQALYQAKDAGRNRLVLAEQAAAY